jgi:outer membrane lipoprotein carrier protein
MKKILLVLMSISFSVFATPQQELSARLAKTEGFSASFAQTVISPDNEVMMEGSGQVEIARPSLFRWTTEMPDENVLVSDGETLWYYSPFIEQVTIYHQEQATAQTPFVLLTRNKASDWDNYHVSQENDNFVLTPTAVDSNQGRFLLEIDEQGVVKGFSVVEQDGQQSQFVFSEFRSQTPDKARFSFIVPEGVDVDDQRN